MTKDEKTQLAKLEQKLDDFTDTARPILDALNGPKGWFAQMETRMCAQENRSKMVFAIFGGAWAIALIVVGEMVRNFYTEIATIEKVISTKP